jgi:hypothetical protein
MAHRTQRQSRSAMTFSPAEWELLTSANEDWHGLWEALAGIRSTLPDLNEEDILKTGQNTLRSLLDKGLVYLCWFRHQTNEEERVSMDESRRLIEDLAKWEPPPWGERYVAFAATDAGERAWRKPPALTGARKPH